MVTRLAIGFGVGLDAVDSCRRPANCCASPRVAALGIVACWPGGALGMFGAWRLSTLFSRARGRHGYVMSGSRGWRLT